MISCIIIIAAAMIIHLIGLAKGRANGESGDGSKLSIGLLLVGGLVVVLVVWEARNASPGADPVGLVALFWTITVVAFSTLAGDLRSKIVKQENEIREIRRRSCPTDEECAEALRRERGRYWLEQIKNAEGGSTTALFCENEGVVEYCFPANIRNTKNSEVWCADFRKVEGGTA